MARTCAQATNRFLYKDSLVQGTYPFTVAGWAKVVSGAASQFLYAVSDGAGASVYTGIAVSGGKLLAVHTAFGGDAVSVASISDGVWFHFACSWPDTTHENLYLDGVKSTGTATTAFTSLTTTEIGSLWKGAANDNLVGDIAEVGVWTVTLDDAEIAALAKAVCPTLIRPQSLVSYWPIGGIDSPELDRWKSGNNLTLNGVPAKAEHPRIYYPQAVA